MIYKNSTSTWIELAQGDVRDADERFFVIGRDPSLKTYFESQTGNVFRSDLSWIRDVPLELSRSQDRSISVVRSLYRPRNRPRDLQTASRTGFRSAIEFPLARARSHGAMQLVLRWHLFRVVNRTLLLRRWYG